MTRYSEYSGGMDGTNYYEYICDCCGETVQLGEFDPLPDGWLQVSIIHHICRSCRYAGAVDKDTITELKTIKEQLKLTGGTASGILMLKGTTTESRQTARMVLADIDLCISKLNNVIIALALEGVLA